MEKGKKMKKEQKKGQVTLFIILGIFILLFFVLIYFGADTIVEDFYTPVTESAGESATKTFVASCIQEVTNDAIIVAGASGGIIYPDEESKLLATEYTVITYVMYNNQETISREKIEDDIARYVEENLDVCIDSFEGLIFDSYDIHSKNEIDADVSIGKYGIDIELYYPLTITSITETTTIDDFYTGLDSSLGDLFDTALLLAENHNEILLIDPLEETTYTKTTYPFDATTTIYTLLDEDNLLAFIFAVGNEHLSSPPELAYISPITLRYGQMWYYQLHATDIDNDVEVFSSDHEYFSVGKNGYIETIVPPPGAYVVEFTVVDKEGSEDSQEVTITVLPAYEES
jgi:hypothetical protein